MTNGTKNQLATFAEIAFALQLMASLVACVGVTDVASMNWKEEALLHDGTKVVVNRSVWRGGRHEVGQQGTYQEQALSFVMPKSSRLVKWEDHRSAELGTSNFLPMLLDIYGDVAYLVVSPMGCLSYNKWGRPNPPYLVFKNENKAWRQIPLSELPSESKATNLIFSAPDIEVGRAETHYVTADQVSQIVSRYKQSEYREILRNPVAAVKGASVTSCEEMIYYKCGWISPQGNFGREHMDRVCK